MMNNWFNISNTAAPGHIPDSVKFSFYIGGFIFFLAVLWTVLKTKEYSPEELKQFTEKASGTVSNSSNRLNPASKFIKNGIAWLAAGTLITIIIFLNRLDLGLYVLFVGAAVFGVLQIITGLLTKQEKTGSAFVSIINDLYNMPKTMRELAVVQFFSWFALFAMWIYTTPAVTHHIYGTSDTTSPLYNQGADWVGVLMAVYNGFAAVMAFVLVWLAKKTNRKTVHRISLIIGGLSLASFYVIKNPQMLLISELGIGLAWASILAMPYAILAGSLPADKMGVYMGIFNFFIVIPQITAASILGFLVKTVFGNEAIYALLLGGLSFVIAAGLTMLVKDVDEVK
jgi:maltose/moltooligosaccharide transporter